MATILVIPNSFTPFTKIRSADMNANFTALVNRINWAGGTDATTGLGDDNLQSNAASGGGLTRATKLKAGTASHVVINAVDGTMSSEAALAASRGGLGFAATFTGNAGKGVIVNPTEDGYALGTPTVDRITESLTGDIATLTAGAAISANQAVCLDLHNGSGSNVYRIFPCISTSANRKTTFLGFAVNAATVVPQITTWTNSAALVTSNTVAWTVNGRSYTQAFITDNDTTLASVATQLLLDPDVQSAVVTDAGSNDRVITITSKGGLSLNITGAAVTGGASQAVITLVNTQAASGQAVQIRCFGPMAGFSGLTVGSLYYVSSSSGGITNSPADSNPLLTGQALSTTVLFVTRPTFTFGASSVMVRGHGSSAGTDQTNAKGDVEHFNFGSWSVGTADTNARFGGGMGESSLNGVHLWIDGKDSTNTKQLLNTAYNKSSWTAGTNRTTAYYSFGNTTLNSVFYAGLGFTSDGSPTNAIDAFNGTTWTVGVTTVTLGRGRVSALTQGSKARWISGVQGGTGRNNHDGYNGSSVATETVFPTADTTGFGAASGASAGAGIAGNGGGASTFSYRWSGSSWGSNTATTAGTVGDGSATTVAAGPAVAYNSNTQLTFLNGGSSASTTSITTTQSYNDTAWSSSTASSTARAGSAGAVI